MTLRRRGALALLALAPRIAAPAPPLRLVVAYPPGGVSDACARALAAPLGERLGRAVVVENRPGAGGAVALDEVARATPDGTSLAFAAITALVFDGSAVRAAARAPQVVPVARVLSTPSLLVATRALTVRDFAALLAAAHARPGALRWATSGVATTGHFILEAVCRRFGLAVVHVPYKGGAQQLTDALGGQFELLSTNVAPMQVAAARDGRWHALAVGAPSRLPALPGVPTFAELGCPAANLASIFGLFAPATTPPALVARLNTAVLEALRTPALRRALAGSGALADGGDAAAFGADIAAARAAFAHG